MKRRSIKEPPRDREMEQLKEMTTLKLTTSQMHERLMADKNALEARLTNVLRDRNAIRKTCQQHSDDDPIIEYNGNVVRSSELLAGYADLIKSLSAQLRSVKEQLGEVRNDV